MYEHVEKPKENKSRAVANPVGQKKSRGQKGFGFVDNRHLAKSQKSLQLKSNDAVIQKFNLVLDDLKEDNSTIGRLVELGILITKKQSGAVEFKTGFDLSKMGDSEVLYILGHGDTKLVGGLTPMKLAQLLKANGLKDNTPIILGSCSGGVVDSGTTYGKELHSEISKLKVQGVTVKAYNGVTAIKQDGSYLVKDEVKMQTHAKEYNDAINNSSELPSAVKKLGEMIKNGNINLIKLMQLTSKTFAQLFVVNEKMKKDVNTEVNY